MYVDICIYIYLSTYICTFLDEFSLPYLDVNRVIFGVFALITTGISRLSNKLNYPLN